MANPFKVGQASALLKMPSKQRRALMRMKARGKWINSESILPILLMKQLKKTLSQSQTKFVSNLFHSAYIQQNTH